MQTFTFDSHRCWIARLVSTNPLLRRTDRVEAAALLLAIMISLLTIPFAGAAATAVYDTRSHLYAHQALTRHRLTATVTKDSSSLDSGSYAVPVQARWTANGGGRTASLQWKDPVKAGDRIDVWVDSSGNQVDPPTPTAAAGFQAAAIAASIVITTIVVTAVLFAATRWRLDRIRHAQLDREIRGLVDEGGKRTGGPDKGRPR